MFPPCRDEDFRSLGVVDDKMNVYTRTSPHNFVSVRHVGAGIERFEEASTPVSRADASVLVS